MNFSVNIDTIWLLDNIEICYNPRILIIHVYMYSHILIDYLNEFMCLILEVKIYMIM